MQNSAVRLVSKRRVPVHTSLDNIFIDFHWLKVRERIIYKILLTVHNCLYVNAPYEVSSLLRYAESERTMKLCETKTSNKYGDRAFSHVGPKLWNLLPHSLRNEHVTLTFKKSLKSFLMTRGHEFHLWINRR